MWKNIMLEAWYNILYFPVGKWDVSGVFQRRYIINLVIFLIGSHNSKKI